MLYPSPSVGATPDVTSEDTSSASQAWCRYLSIDLSIYLYLYIYRSIYIYLYVIPESFGGRHPGCGVRGHLQRQPGVVLLSIYLSIYLSISIYLYIYIHVSICYTRVLRWATPRWWRPRTPPAPARRGVAARRRWRALSGRARSSSEGSRRAAVAGRGGWVAWCPVQRW